MRNVLIYILLPVIFAACIEVDTRDEQIQQSIIVQGLLVSGEAPQNIRIFQLDEFGNTTSLSGAELVLTGPFGEVELIELEAGSYGNEDESIFALADYRLRGVGPENQLFTAITSTPPEFEITNPVPATISIDVNQPLQQIFNLDWTDSGDAEYILVLKVLAENPVEIPFQDGGGNFEVVFANPQPESGTVLLASDLRYYGNHELIIYAVSPDYADLFNPLLLVNRDDVPYISGQLTDAYGFFEAATKTSISFFVE